MSRDIVEQLRDIQQRFIFQGNSKFALSIASEIESLRARVAELERADRSPRPPEELVGALNDRIHPASGRLLNATPIHGKLNAARAALLQGQEPLGAEFEAVWDANAAELYKEAKP